MQYSFLLLIRAVCPLWPELKLSPSPPSRSDLNRRHRSRLPAPPRPFHHKSSNDLRPAQRENSCRQHKPGLVSSAPAGLARPRQRSPSPGGRQPTLRGPRWYPVSPLTFILLDVDSFGLRNAVRRPGIKRLPPSLCVPPYPEQGAFAALAHSSLE